MHFVRIVILCVIAAIVYGILHDLITAHLCVEYFTIGQRRVIDSTSPTALALAWGVIATWWMGVLLGLPWAICARVGRWPKLTAEDMHRRILFVLLGMFALALIAGVTGRILAINQKVWLVGRVARDVRQSITSTSSPRCGLTSRPTPPAHSVACISTPPRSACAEPCQSAASI